MCHNFQTEVLVHTFFYFIFWEQFYMIEYKMMVYILLNS